MTLILKYRREVLALIAASQIFSSVLFVPIVEDFGGSVFRVLLVLMAVLLFMTNAFSSLSRWPRRALIVTAILSVWMAISLAWTPSLPTGARQMSYIVTILLWMYVLENLIRDENDFVVLCRAISIFGLIIIAFSLYEIQTGNHFFNSAIAADADFDSSLRYRTEGIAWFTFGNPNDLSVHLSVCCFSLIYCVRKSLYSLASYIFYFSLVLYMTFALEARIISGAILLFILLFFVVSRLRRPIVAALLVKGALIGSGLMMALALAVVERAEFLDVSSFVRLQLIWSGIEMAFQTLLLGVGVGGFETEMWARGFVGATYGITNPHNAMARMLAENGVVGLALFGFLLIGPVLALGTARVVNRATGFVAGMVVALPLLFSSGSDPLAASSLQLAIGLLWTGCRFLDGDSTTPARMLNPPGGGGPRSHEVML